MNLLLDTHLLLWGTTEPERLSESASRYMGDEGNELVFSAVSMWEIAIKRNLGRPDFQIDVRMLRRTLLRSGFTELPISSEHGIVAGSLPPLHRDPFDRLLIAQASSEGLLLLTSDSLITQYPGPIRRV